MDEMPMMEPPGGDCEAIWRAAAWVLKKAPSRLVRVVVV